jgi:hypothetical protein
MLTLQLSFGYRSFKPYVLCCLGFYGELLGRTRNTSTDTVFVVHFQFCLAPGRPVDYRAPRLKMDRIARPGLGTHGFLRLLRVPFFATVSRHGSFFQ